MSILRFGAVLMVAASLCACATITRGTRQKFYVNSTPSEAEVEMSNGLRCRTPCKLKVARKSDFTVRIIKPGYEPAEVHVQGKVKGGGAAGGMLGNALLGGLVGLGVDASTGAMLNLRPNPVEVTLVPIGSAAAPAAADGAAPAQAAAPADAAAASAGAASDAAPPAPPAQSAPPAPPAEPAPPAPKP